MREFEDKIEKKLGTIVRLIRESLDPDRILLFGSRATGTALPGSDIDVAVEGVHRPSIRAQRKLKEALDAAAGLYMVDLLFLDDLRDEGMVENVKETGVVLYEKK